MPGYYKELATSQDSKNLELGLLKNTQKNTSLLA
jgi:hypothetical protein